MTKMIRLGLLRLSDAAPVIFADEEGIFSANGLEVSLSVEPSWANVADKLGYGLLDAAVMPPPLAMACALGLRGRKTGMIIPMSLSANGNAITISNSWRTSFEHGADGFKANLNARKERPVFAVVHGFSTHDLLLRYWLAANRIDPDEDVEITVLPPTEMAASMADGKIDGFCAGAPWGHVAEDMGVGFIAVRSSEIWLNHPEKCLALRADFAEANPECTHSLLIALREAAASCADPSRRSDLANLLAQRKYLNLPVGLIERSLDPADGGPVFDLNFPVLEHARWFAAQMLRWNMIPATALPVAVGLYRPDLYTAAGGISPAIRPEIFCDGAY